jgi:autotransporter-associated beta strand protein
VTNNGTLTFNRSDAITVANAISGSGAITKLGTGTTTLTGTNNNAGVTTVSNGVLQIGNGGTTGTLGAGAITTNASLVFNRSDTLTVANAISGTGSVTNSGGAANVLNLNGAQSEATLNANTGTTNVNGAFTNGTSSINVAALANFSTSQKVGAVTVGANSILRLTASAPFADAAPTVAAVPEPGSMGLLIVGALGLLARRRRASK